MNDCIPCAARRAEQRGWILATKTSPGTTAGAWGSARQGQTVAVPPRVLEERPGDFEAWPPAPKAKPAASRKAPKAKPAKSSRAKTSGTRKRATATTTANANTER